ncbi:MAG: MBL fold metallo-hydrolase, partial [Desulfobacca sp.]|uniref:MBL fold metallo-hydrolase n=1 Tax=Desulfobacca sp. TaxID=2067990 RepID=UPI0040493106
TYKNRAGHYWYIILSRFQVMKIALLLPLIFLHGCPVSKVVDGAASSESYKLAPAHHGAGKFRNPHLAAKGRWGDFWRWRFGLGPQEKTALPPETIPDYQPEVLTPDLNCLNHADPQTIQVTWLGHATFLVQVAGLNILTDPMFSDRASPVQFAGPKRLIPPPLRPEELPPIHAVVISHNHYDHLDRNSVKRLGSGVTFFVPLGLATWFRQAGLPKVRELDWWQSAPFDRIRFHCVPVQHFSIRTPFDANRTLWAGWVLATPAGKIFFAGDTGYSPDFWDIGRRLGPMRLALIPIGGYMPRWFMRPMHLDPREAVQVHRDVGAQQSIGMHWGTFKLTEEPLAEPPLYLRQVLAEEQLPPEQFLILRCGETKVFAADPEAALPQNQSATAP